MLDVTKDSPAPDYAPVREEVKAIKEAETLSWEALGRESNVAASTLAAFVAGTYKGDNSRVAADLQRWLETRRQRERVTAELPSPPAFLMTPTAQDIFSSLSFAQAAPDFAVLVGGAGIGKTTALDEYRKRGSNVWLLTADPSIAKAANVLSILAEQLGVSERRNAFIARAISAHVRGKNGLVIVDDAQQLEAKAFDQLRTTILDLGGCGIAVFGNESMLTALQGSADRRTQAYAQLHSRVGVRKVQHAARAADICMVLEAWGITAPAVLQVLKQIARKPGALRIMNKVIRLAAFGAGCTVANLTVSHIERAWAQLSSQTIES